MDSSTKRFLPSQLDSNTPVNKSKRKIIILEETVIHAGAAVGLFITASDTWGEWAGGTIAASLMTPLAALTTSVTYQRLATNGAPGTKTIESRTEK